MQQTARLLVVPLALFVLLAVPGSSVYRPYVIAALGDSITQAANACCEPGNHPAQSWSTGNDGTDSVRSHFERLAALPPPAGITSRNDAVSGAEAADLPAQASEAIAQQADYITILIGANDLCAPSASTMTPVADFAVQINTTLDALHRGLPKARIFVASIPDLYRLWSVLHTNPSAAQVWSTRRICQSMLSAANTETQRREVRSRETAYNRILAQACGKYANCRWDGGTVYGYRFSAGQISTLDYFHPGPGGQAALAELTWNQFHQYRPKTGLGPAR
jgi:lysophospholipase L1-like esterase